jgi:hypothetical protein
MPTALETLHARRAETERGRAAVETLEAERARAATAHVAEMSAANLHRLEQLDRQMTTARLQLETLTRREAEAQSIHDAEVLAAKRAALRDLTAEADNDGLFAELRPLIEQVVDLDRAVAHVVSGARSLCGKQRVALEQAVALARELGGEDAPSADPTHLDDFRVACNIAIARARAAEGRARTRSELFLFGVDDQPRPGEKHEVTIALATHDGYDFARRILEPKKETA